MKNPIWNEKKGAHGRHMVLQCLSLIWGRGGTSCLSSSSSCFLFVRSFETQCHDGHVWSRLQRVSPLGGYACFPPLPVVQMGRSGFPLCIVTSSSWPACLFPFRAYLEFSLFLLTPMKKHSQRSCLDVALNPIILGTGLHALSFSPVFKRHNCEAGWNNRMLWQGCSLNFAGLHLFPLCSRTLLWECAAWQHLGHICFYFQAYHFWIIF